MTDGASVCACLLPLSRRKEENIPDATREAGGWRVWTMEQDRKVLAVRTAKGRRKRDRGSRRAAVFKLETAEGRSTHARGSQLISLLCYFIYKLSF